MATESTELEKQDSSFFNARWFPSAVAGLALVIAIGGHGFTALNSQSAAKLNSEVQDLKEFRQSTINVDGLQDRNLQTLKNELVRQRRAIQTLETKISELERDDKAGSGSNSSAGIVRPVAPERKPELARLHRQSEQQFAGHQSQDGATVQQFTSALRQAIKSQYVSPAWEQGAKFDYDDVVVLQLTFARDGYIHNADVAVPSGMDEFDKAVLKAVLTLNRFPAVAGLEQSDYLRVARFQIGISPAQMM